MKIVSIVLRPIKEKKVKTDERVLQGARELFYRHGIKSITMDDIAAHIGMSKKTIYEQYDDKKHIVTALTLAEMVVQDQEMENARKSSVDAIDELMKAMTCVSDVFTKINPAMLYDLQKFYPGAWEKFRDFKEKKIRGFMEENLKRGIKQELYRKDLNIKVIARMRLELVEIGFNPFIFHPAEFSLKEVQMVLLDHFMHGITTLKGHKLINKYKQIKEED